MHTLSKFTIAGFSMLAIAACNSSSQTVPGGTVCPAGYNPTPMSVSGAQKAVPVDPKANQSTTADSQMPPGNYVYTLSDLTYNQKGPVNAKPIQIQVHDFAAADVSAKQSVICLGNAKANMQLPDTQFDAVTDVVVCSDFHQVVKTRHFQFNITNGAITFAQPCGKDKCLTSSSDLASKDPQMFIRDDQFDFQWRTSHDDAVSSWIMSVRMTWVPFSVTSPEPVECRQCTQPPPSTDTTPSTLPTGEVMCQANVKNTN